MRINLGDLILLIMFYIHRTGQSSFTWYEWGLGILIAVMESKWCTQYPFEIKLVTRESLYEHCDKKKDTP